MWGEDGTRRSQPLQDRGRREGRWERKEMDERGEKRVWKWDERVGQLRGITAGQLCIYWSAAAGWFFCQSHQRKNRWKGGVGRKEDCCVVLFFFIFIFIFFVCCQPVKWEVCKSAPAEHITRETNSIQFAESELPANIHCYFQQPPGVESRFTGCFTWSWGSIQRRWSLRFSVYCCCTSVPSAVL